MLQAVGNALRTPELRRKLIVVALVLLVFRFFSALVVPGVNVAALQSIFKNNSVLNLLDLFSGGGLSRLSVVAMGMNPYINATIIMQLMTVISDRIKEMSKEGEAGRRRLAQYTRRLAVPLGLLQAFGLTTLFRANGVFPFFDLYHIFVVVITLTGGTILTMWLGELITEYGIGNGISLIIFAGIVGRSPQNVGRIAGGGIGGFGSIALLILVALGATVLIITFQEAQRRIPIQSAQRVVGNKISQARASYLPLRLTGAGVIPIIFAISIMFFPTQIAQFFPTTDIAKFILRDWSASGPNLPVTIAFNAVYFLLVFMFTFFYTSVQYDTNDMADNLKKYATFVPGIRPGKPTADYLGGVLLRITVAGGLFLGFITVVLPLLTAAVSGIPPATFYLGSTGILIVVAVALDTMRQIETQLQMRQYRGFIR